jgi:hypothetical protein
MGEHFRVEADFSGGQNIHSVVINEESFLRCHTSGF